MREESINSLKKRISQVTGFMPSKIDPAEGSLSNGRYTSITFIVNGAGFWTDFINYGRAPQYDTSDLFED